MKVLPGRTNAIHSTTHSQGHHWHSLEDQVPNQKGFTQEMAFMIGWSDLADMLCAACLSPWQGLRPQGRRAAGMEQVKASRGVEGHEGSPDDSSLSDSTGKMGAQILHQNTPREQEFNQLQGEQTRLREQLCDARKATLCSLLLMKEFYY
jgi:hypothetical protein